MAVPKKSAELTGTGVVMATPLYMAPEAVRSARALDASADVFAFGIIAYEVLTGQAPFAVSVPRRVVRRRDAERETIATLDAEVVAIAADGESLALVLSGGRAHFLPAGSSRPPEHARFDARAVLSGPRLAVDTASIIDEVTGMLLVLSDDGGLRIATPSGVRSVIAGTSRPV